MDVNLKPRKKTKLSTSLTDAQFEALFKYRKTFETEVECAASIGIDRNVLNRVMFCKSGSPKTINRILRAIENNL